MNYKKIKKPKDSILKANKITNISTWEKLSHEWSGTRDKLIVRHPISGHLFLVKFPKYGENEILYELFNCYFGKSLGLKYADYFLCIYDNQLCIASKSFLPAGNITSELWEMKELICHYASNVPGIELKFGRDKDVLKEHHIDQIYMILSTEFGPAVLPNFFRMIAFDCLTGHGDRHWENYGVLLKHNHTNQQLDFEFAPIYDTAYGYHLEFSDEKIKQILKDEILDQESWYQTKIKGLSKMTIEGNIKASHIDLFKHLITNGEYARYHKFLFEILNSYDRRIVQTILKMKPFSTRLTEDRKNVILKILEMRFKLLKKVLQKNLK